MPIEKSPTREIDKHDSLEEIEMLEDEEAPPENPTKPKKLVIYSDKSESSVDEMMEDTPSNYNIPNGRVDGKSIGLKALFMYAKKQGINMEMPTGKELTSRTALDTISEKDKGRLPGGSSLGTTPVV